ncbi:MAG: response regulator, partial [Sterolibacterium sp.]
LPLLGTASGTPESSGGVPTEAPVKSRAAAPRSSPARRQDPPLAAASLPDDRERLKGGDRSILIVEDDLAFAKILQEMIRDRGFPSLVAADGESGLALASRYLPCAIILDVMLPHIDGWDVMRCLKDDPATRHIPVHFITCLENRQKAMNMGAIGFATKPVSVEQLNQILQSIEGAVEKSTRELLIVEDNPAEAKSMVALLEEGDVAITVAATGQEAIDILSSRPFDCMILDLGLSDMSGFDLLEHIQKMERARRIPVIIHSGRELTHEDERMLRRFAESIIIKGAKSPERLLNEVSLFLHLVESNLHPNKQRMIRASIDKEALLEGKKVLLVDDDMRNIFSLTSVLAEKNMTVIEAENGKEAIALLEQHPDIGIVLMDIMMPEMDGYTAMREIRKNRRFANIPIIAMTAKALKGDQEKCMAAGASDYIAKPIDVDKLFSLIRVWVFQHT